MMIHITLPDNSQKRLIYYLAMEEYVAGNLDKIVRKGDNGLREAFFIWQVPPTVIFGRNQVMEAEVNMPYCKAKNVNLFRRKSGGGCVYSDMGNIMLSYISDSTDVKKTFEKFLRKLAEILNKLGLDASHSGRNDIMIGDKKVSGNAFFLLPHSSVVHGTMLYDTDFDELVRTITPSEVKIRSKGVASVRKHVTNVREELRKIYEKVKDGSDAKSMKQKALCEKYSNIEAFKHYLISGFCSGDTGGEIENLVLGEEDLREIDKIEATYLEPDFFNGKNHKYCFEKNGHIEGMGNLSIEISLEGDVIDTCMIKGDIFPLRGDADRILTGRLKGVKNTRKAVSEALKDVCLEKYIMNLKTEAFIDILFED